MRNNARSAALARAACAKPVTAPPESKPMTHNERCVYRELCAFGAPMKAYALLEKLRKEGIRAPMSIYRALDALTERGLVKKVASLNAFAAVRADGERSVGAFVTCRRCGRTREVSLSEALILRMLAPAGMDVDDVFIEAYGDCRDPACAGD